MIERKRKELNKAEKCVVIGLITPLQNERMIQEYLDELVFLVHTAGAETIKRYTQKLNHPISSTFIGKGKAEEIALFIKEHEIDFAVFDDELSPTQMRNLEKTFSVKVLDRTSLILDIFAQRAQTAHARTQVELAQYEYLYPRLVGMWTHLSRQKGGIGLRGPGETEIETDRRIVRDKISLLKQKLAEIDKQKFTQRQNRGSFVRVSLVGYTNVGKSTILNLLSKSEVFAENKLFATLDTTVRKVVLKNLPFLLSDTVGFIRKLPHQLVESFKSTLDETRESDLLIHVVDISHPNFLDQIHTVNKTLQEIGAFNKPIIMVFNKIDNIQISNKDEFDYTGSDRVFDLQSFKENWTQHHVEKTVFISAINKNNIDEFKELLFNEISDLHRKIYPYNNFLY